MNAQEECEIFSNNGAPRPQAAPAALALAAQKSCKIWFPTTATYFVYVIITLEHVSAHPTDSVPPLILAPRTALARPLGSITSSLNITSVTPLAPLTKTQSRSTMRPRKPSASPSSPSCSPCQRHSALAITAASPPRTTRKFPSGIAGRLTSKAVKILARTNVELDKNIPAHVTNQRGFSFPPTALHAVLSTRSTGPLKDELDVPMG